MGKVGFIVLGAIVIGTLLAVVFGTSYGLAPTGSLALLFGLIGFVISAALVFGVGAIRARAAATSNVRPPSAEPSVAREETPH